MKTGINRKILSAISVVLVTGFSQSAIGDEFSFTFEWGKIPLCDHGSTFPVPNPIFTLQNVPAGTKKINMYIVDLNRPSNDHGGGSIESKGQNVIQPGAFEYYSPCPPDGSHEYEWTAWVKDAKGETIGKAKAKKYYP